MRDEDRALIAGVAYWLTIAVASGLVWWPLSVIAAAVALAAFFGIAQITVWMGDGEQAGWLNLATTIGPVEHAIAWCPPERGVFISSSVGSWAFALGLCARLRLDFHSCDSCSVRRLTLGPVVLQVERLSGDHDHGDDHP